MHRSLFLSLGLIVAICAGARAAAPIEEDCLSADAGYAVEACAAVLADGVARKPIDLFRLHSAAGNAELNRGNFLYALVEFDAALNEVEKDGGASPPDDEWSAFLVDYAMANLRADDSDKALDLLGTAKDADASNRLLPFLTAYAHFSAGDVATASSEAAALLAKAPKDLTLLRLKGLAEQWQTNPATAVADCKAAYDDAECGAGALALHKNEKAAADLVSSVLDSILQGDRRRMGPDEAPGAWSDCRAPEPEYAGLGCDMILGGVITPEERYEASVRRILAFLHNDDAGLAVVEAQHLVARVDYGVARPPDDGPSPAAARALLAQAHLQRGEIDEAAKVLDDALADEPDDVTFLALRGLVDLADNKVEDAEANLDLAFDQVPDDDPSDVSIVSGIVSAAASSAEEGVGSCKDAYPDAACGSDELAGGDEAAALAAIADSINDHYLGDAQHPFTLIGGDTLQ